MASLLTACEKPLPRNFADFTEDRIAREGTLARCNMTPEATLHDIECAHARRAASAIALRNERERREALELESEQKLAALRSEFAARERAQQAATVVALANEKAAYEALWRGEHGAQPGQDRFGGPGLAGVPRLPTASDAGPQLEEVVISRRLLPSSPH
jgi:hypothetical protein